MAFHKKEKRSPLHLQTLLTAIAFFRLLLKQKALAYPKKEKPSPGYRFALQGLGVARVTVKQFAERIFRLYE
jgi:hypothetical protein